jgi:pyruvate,water dikinase
MKTLKILSIALSLVASTQVWAQAKIMNPGEAVGQLIILSADDINHASAKFMSLNPLSIPVFAELPMDLSVTAGAITLKQQNLLSHVQLKSRARKTPNLDISQLEGGVSSALLGSFRDGDWIRMKLTNPDTILIEASTKEAAEAAYEAKQANLEPVNLDYDGRVRKVYRSQELGSEDHDKVGSKAANYAELMKALNTPERTVVRPGFAVPMSYYEQFVNDNPAVKALIEDVVSDPIMNDLMDVQYRAQRLEELRKAMTEKTLVVRQDLIDDLLAIYEQQRGPDGKLRKMKMRSSTNSEDLPNFNGAGLYDSLSYKPYKGEREKTRAQKEATLREVLQGVWSSVWMLRAFDERNLFGIPHDQVKMAMQVNPSFGKEDADGVVVTKNVSGDANNQGTAVYVETQRGDVHGVANPVPGVKPQKILIFFDESRPLDTSAYRVKTLQMSNIADDNVIILDQDNPIPVMTDAEAKDLAYQSLKARAHFKPILSRGADVFDLDLEFKVDSEDNGQRTVFLKQARPLIQE